MKEGQGKTNYFSVESIHLSPRCVQEQFYCLVVYLQKYLRYYVPGEISQLIIQQFTKYSFDYYSVLKCLILNGKIITNSNV